MTPSWLVFLLLALMGVERVYETFFRTKEPPGKIKEKWTLKGMVIFHTLISLSALLEYTFTHPLLNLWLTFLGCFFYFFALWGRYKVYSVLGRNWSKWVKIVEGQRLIKEGPYRLVRHPFYLFVILETTGIPLIVNSWIGLSIALFGYIPFLLMRAKLEEKLLIEEFGQEYLDYKKFTPLISPFPWKRIK